MLRSSSNLTLAILMLLLSHIVPTLPICPPPLPDSFPLIIGDTTSSDPAYFIDFDLHEATQSMAVVGYTRYESSLNQLGPSFISASNDRYPMIVYYKSGQYAWSNSI